MDLAEFIRTLESTRDWQWGYLDPAIPALRASQGPLHFCPLTAVCFTVHQQFHRNGDPFTAAQTLGIDRSTAESIMNAADHWTGHDRQLRGSLLRAVGLEVPA